jgi:hypothetical protein
LVFIDETWTKTNMTRLRGWAPKGERLVDKVPHGRWKTATFLAALRNDCIDAPCLFDGPINGERFRAYVEQFLAPNPQTGRRRDSRQPRISQRKGRAARDPGHRSPPRVSAQILARPQSDRAGFFAKFKTLLRKAEARTYDAVANASAAILAKYLPEESAAYVRNAGYA